jgi:hypothetical protein
MYFCRGLTRHIYSNEDSPKSSNRAVTENCSFMNMFIKNCSFMNTFIKNRSSKQEHVHQNPFIKEGVNINFQYHEFLVQPAGVGALCRACRLKMTLNYRFIFPSCLITYIIFFFPVSVPLKQTHQCCTSSNVLRDLPS